MLLIGCRFKVIIYEYFCWLSQSQISVKGLPMRKPSQELVEILAENIKSYRRSKNLSQEKFAEICELHRTYIGSVERGERNVSLSTLEVFASVLGVSVPDLLTPGGIDKVVLDKTRS